MTEPEGLDPAIHTREIVFDAEVDLDTPFLKLATVNRGGAGHRSNRTSSHRRKPHQESATKR